MQKGFAPVLIVILIALVVGGYLLYQKQTKPTPSPTAQITPTQLTPAPITPTPTPYICPTTNQKTQADIDQENAENNLSSYTIKVDPDGNIPERIYKISILEKKLLPCESVDEQYCKISNGTWTIKYPKAWNLYRIKRHYDMVTISTSTDYYDLKFEYQSSYFYLKESATMGGQPIIISDASWEQLRSFCPDNFYTDSTKKTKSYLCSGNVTGCGVNMDGYRSVIYPLNSFYKSFIDIGDDVPEYKSDRTSIYNWYIHSLDFGREKLTAGGRIYTFSDNFYSNDEQFISELKKIYISSLKYFR